MSDIPNPNHSRRSPPYFFAFITSVPNKVIAHSIRIETIEIPNNLFEDTQFTLFPADYEKDKRIRQLLYSAYVFIRENNIDPKTLCQ